MESLKPDAETELNCLDLLWSRAVKAAQCKRIIGLISNENDSGEMSLNALLEVFIDDELYDEARAFVSDDVDDDELVEMALKEFIRVRGRRNDGQENA